MDIDEDEDADDEDEADDDRREPDDEVGPDGLSEDERAVRDAAEACEQEVAALATRLLPAGA